jgi:tripartite-type tricarboxylate transporter receptor subunit TctC
MKPALVGRRYYCLVLVAIALAAAGCKKAGGGDAAANFPTEPITMTVGSGAGGGIDTATRGIQPYLAKALNATVIVENRPGNNSLIAANYVLSSKPDGHHLFIGTNATILNSQLHPDSWKSDKNSVDAFIPIYSWMHEDGNGIVVKKDSAFDTMDALAAEAHKRPLKLCIAGGLGSTDHVTALMIRKAYGGNWVIVPMDSAAEGTAAVLGGNCDAASCSPAGASIDPAQLKMLAVSTKKRAARFPDAPTFEEIGKPEVTLHFIIGAMAPLGTPQAVIDKLEAGFEKARNDPGFIEWAKRTNQPIGDEGWNGKQFYAALKEAYGNLQGIIPEMKAELQKAQQGN